MYHTYTYKSCYKILWRLNPDKTINLNANHLDLIYSIAIRNPIYIPSPPNLIISIPQIPSIFHPSTALDTLQLIANHNSNLTELTFYTSGSVLNLGNSQCSIGIGWIQLENQTIIHNFQAQ